MYLGFLNSTQDNEVINGLGTISNWVKTWALPLAAIGTVSMALLQIAKNVFPLRSSFQRRHFREWLSRSANEAADSAGSAAATGDNIKTEESSPGQPKKKSKVCSGVAEHDLINLVSSGDEEAFYYLPIEDLCGQIKSVASVVLDYPSLHENLLRCLANQANAKDIYVILHPPSPEIFLKRADQSTEGEKRAVKEYAAAKTRLALQVRCSVDAIQTSIGFRWKRWLQIASMFLSAALGMVALLVAPGQDYPYPTLGATILIGLLSGFLAPVARDLVAAVEKWRT